MIKNAWKLVILLHIGLALWFLVMIASYPPSSSEWAFIAAIVLCWFAYLLALIGNRAGHDTLLGLAIEARKAELRKRIREREREE